MTNEEFETHVAPGLEVIDRLLAEQGHPLPSRVQQAAMLFVRMFVVKWTDDDGQTIQAPDDGVGFVFSRMFRELYRYVDVWYRTRYGNAAIAVPADRGVLGLALIYQTPFELRVPTARVEPGLLGETFWLGWRDTVSPDEDPCGWVVSPPNLDMMSVEARRAVAGEIGEVAAALRVLSSSVLRTSIEDPTVYQLTGGVLAHVEAAASDALRLAEGRDVQRAFWSLQMAAEQALKAFLQQKTGVFRQTHDLHALHRLTAAHGLRLPRGVVSRLPGVREVIARRSGRGTPCTIVAFFEAYRATLALAAATARQVRRRLGPEVRLELRKPPWLRDGDR